VVKKESEKLEFMKTQKIKNNIVLLLAQGLGTGLVPFAPGTFGSILGMLWFSGLAFFQNLYFFLTMQVISFFISVYLCGKAEKILKMPDPGSVVLDEIVAIPLCFTLPVLLYVYRHNCMPDVGYFFIGKTCWLGITGFILFRVFDIIKPWPIRNSQKLPGGWGITIDDLLAGLWTSILLCTAIALFQ